MIPISLVEMQLLIATTLFILGCLSVLLGVFILISRGYNRELRSIATHTARLGHKGLAQEVSGLVSSASGLIESINQLVRTASGVGAFLIFLGMIMLASSYWIISQVDSLPI